MSCGRENICHWHHCGHQARSSLRTLGGKAAIRFLRGRAAEVLYMGAQDTKSPPCHRHKIMRSSRCKDLRGSRWGVVGRVLHSGKERAEKERFLCLAFENSRQDVVCTSPSASDQVHVDSKSHSCMPMVNISVWTKPWAWKRQMPTSLLMPWMGQSRQSGAL